MREAGFKVLAKTTGSKPIIIYPDGRQEEIKRKGLPSILEQKSLLKLGGKLKVNSLLCELMSIHPESAFAESVQILKPHILAITNVRLDHLEQMGSSREEIARSLASSIPEKSTVIVHKDEFFPVFQQSAQKLGSKLIQVSSRPGEEYFQLKKKLPYFEFRENVELALAVAEFLNIKRETALKGMATVQPDFGSLKIWSAGLGSPPRRFYFASAFAANDPQSTHLVISDLLKKKTFNEKEIIGILNFRKDRGDRTLQWLEALRKNAFPEINKFYLVGFHAHAFKKRLDFKNKVWVNVLKKREPAKIIEQILKEEKEEALLVGMGNMAGMGKEFVDYLEIVGMPYAL